MWSRSLARLHDLSPDWLNTGAVAILHNRLPEGFENRLDTYTFGRLDVAVLGRQDLVRLKLYAAASEGPGSPHVQDLHKMELTQDEFDDAAHWTRGLYPPDSPLDEVADVVAILERSVR